MDKKDKAVVCCFCGLSLPISEAVLIAVYPTQDKQEVQALYCHRYHFSEVIHKDIPLHPALVE
jgi:hypothetical protein